MQAPTRLRNRRTLTPVVGRARFAERVDLDPSSPWWGEHRARYRWAAAQLGPGRVLDVACGSGLGLPVLADGGRAVIGVDLDPAAAAGAAALAVAPVVAADGGRLPFATASFDAVTSFETIEHVNDPVGLLAEVRRVLRPGGVLYASSPNAVVTRPVDGVPRNPFHLQEYDPDGFAQVLGTAFAEVEVLGQATSDGYGRYSLWTPAPGVPGAVQALALKATLRLPAGMRERVSQLALRRPFAPAPEDYTFGEVTDRSHVLVARCR